MAVVDLPPAGSRAVIKSIVAGGGAVYLDKAGNIVGKKDKTAAVKISRFEAIQRGLIVETPVDTQEPAQSSEIAPETPAAQPVDLGALEAADLADYLQETEGADGGDPGDEQPPEKPKAKRGRPK